MRFRFITLCLCFFVSIPLSASQIEHAMMNNWKPKKLRKVIRAEQNIGRLNEHDETYLHIAVRLNRPDHLDIIVRERPEIIDHLMHRDAFHQTAIEQAISLDRIEPFRLLLGHLQNLNYRIWNRYRWTLMHLAARYNRVEFIRELVRAGADVNAVDETQDRWTPLDVALHHGQQAAADALFEFGGRVNALDLTNEPVPETRQAMDFGFSDGEDEFGGFRMPLSDFSFGPALVRIAVGSFIVGVILRQAILFGSY